MDVEYQLNAKLIDRNVLETELDEDGGWTCDEYQRLETQISDLRDRLDADSEAPTDRRVEYRRDHANPL